MKRFILFFLAGIALFACEQKTGYEIEGEIINLQGDQLLLERIASSSQTVIDTASLNIDGEFEMSGPLENPALFQIRPQNGRGVIVYLEPGSELKVEIDFDNPQDYTVTGNKESEEILAFNQFINERKERKSELIEEFRSATDSIEKGELVEKIQGYDTETNELIGEKVKESTSPHAGLLMIGSLQPNKNRELFNQYAERLQLELPNSDYTADFQKRVDKLNSTKPLLKVGDVAHEISMENPKGEIINLSDTRGKYVLLDFWAAWCGPCRRENPNVVDAYEEYKDDGFTVFGVSLDRTKNAWIKAIEQDNLKWPYHVSDLKYWNNAAAKNYGVTGIPANFLLNPEGEVIAQNLRGPALQNKLQEIFSE